MTTNITVDHSLTSATQVHVKVPSKLNNVPNVKIALSISSGRLGDNLIVLFFAEYCGQGIARYPSGRLLQTVEVVSCKLQLTTSEQFYEIFLLLRKDVVPNTTTL